MRRTGLSGLGILAVAFVVMQLTVESAQAGPVTYDFVGHVLNFCGYGCEENAPANWETDRIVASLTFDSALPANMPFQDMYSSPSLVAWSIGDILNFITLSSAAGDVLQVPSELFPSPLMLSTDADGNINRWVMGYGLDEDSEVEDVNEIGILNPPVLCPAEECEVDVYYWNFLTPHLRSDQEWDSGVVSLSPTDDVAGLWTQQETPTEVPEPATLTLTLTALAAGLFRSRRRRSRSDS
jgi:hypothetical protein